MRPLRGLLPRPPYSIAHDYVKNDEHAREALEYNTTQIREQFIGLRGRIGERTSLYREDLTRSLDEVVRVLKPHGSRLS